jgi:TonB family protein
MTNSILSGRHIIRYGVLASLFLHLIVGLLFIYLKNSQFTLMSISELESRSLDVDFINEEALRRLLQSPEKPVAEPVETVIEEQQPAKVKEEKEEKPLKPVEAELEQTKTPEDELFEPPTQEAADTDEITEIETVESAIEVERISREDVRKNFSSLVKNLRVDLGNRSQSVKARTKVRKEERTSATRAQKVQTIVASNEGLFEEKKLVAKWKQFPMSRIMLMKYMPQVDQVIQSHWKLPFEMDHSLEAQVRVIVSKSGKILDFEIVETSSNRFFNHTVRQVFKNLDQLPPLPEDFSGESTEIGLRFTSQQFQHE